MAIGAQMEKMLSASENMTVGIRSMERGGYMPSDKPGSALIGNRCLITKMLRAFHEQGQREHIHILRKFRNPKENVL